MWSNQPSCIDADEEAIFPCGVSRQRMSEFGVEDVIVVHKDSFEKYKFELLLNIFTSNECPLVIILKSDRTRLKGLRVKTSRL